MLASSLRDYGPFLDALAGLSWPARRPVGAGSAGSHPSRLRGMAADFTEYRPYRFGDDPRRLDWKLLARTDRAYLRLTDDNATRSTLILVDASASLAFPFETMAKWRQACRLAVGLASVAQHDGDPAGLVVAHERGTVRLPPRSRAGTIPEMARALDAVAPSGSAPLSPALEQVRAGWRLVLISDFLSDELELLPLVRQRIVAGAEVFAVQVVSEGELRPVPTTRLAVDPEAPAVRRVLQPDTLPEYTKRFADWRAGLRRAWRHAGAEFTEVLAEEEPVRAIRRIVAGVEDTR
ncbi:MAG: DUF58 domain-containing protein [Gemmatimonadales bacterium]